jgi:serine/threonine-protein kinase
MEAFSVGATVGGYAILEEIGRGGMATVYRAHQLSMNRDVALKVLPSQYLNQPTSLDRFKLEASIVARLEHRAIVPVHDYGEFEGIPYLVMRYMDGGSVDDLLAAGPISPERTLQIVLQIAPALDYAHRQGVLHRDLKPSNILLDANGDAYLTDFGIARILGHNTRPLTTSGVVGTPSYMSPEQAQGHDLDGRSDVYALGVVLFEMLTGTRPFEGDTPYTVAVKHVTERPPSPCAINPALSRAVENVLLKTLEKKRENRYGTAVALADALKHAIEGARGSAAMPPVMTETEPSLTERLKAGAARRRLDTGRVLLRRPEAGQPLAEPRSSPSPPAISYAVPRVVSRRRRKSNGWATWLAAAILAALVVLTVAVGGVYYLINEPTAPRATTPDYAATAVFKLTATKEAITQPTLGVSDPGGSTSAAEVAPTPLPTNTPRPPAEGAESDSTHNTGALPE